MWLEKSRHILSTYVEQRSFALGWGSARTVIEKYLVPLDGGKKPHPTKKTGQTAESLTPAACCGM